MTAMTFVMRGGAALALGSFLLGEASAGERGGAGMEVTLATHGDTTTVAGAREPRRISLLIGIGAYQHPEFRTVNNAGFASALAGTGNDVSRMQTSLRGWGFEEGPDQRVLLDGQASKRGIEEAFRWLAERADESQDVVVVYYSGHGSWAPDSAIDSIRKLDEEDGYDEALVPWDTRDMHEPRQLVLDDELGHWLAQLRTTNVTVIVDACHSGSTTRGAAAGFPRARGGRPPPTTGTLGAGGLFSGSEHALNHVLMSAAAPHELAYEDRAPEGVVLGQYTYHLTSVLDQARRGSTTYEDLTRQVHARLGVARQTPQMEGDGSAVLFRVHENIPQRAYGIATPVRDSIVRLDLGAVHGVRRNSFYDVFGPAESQFLGAAQAQLRIDSITDTQSFATVVGTGSVPRGGRAVLTRVPQGARALDILTVYLEPSARSLRDSLRRDSTWVRVTEDPTDAQAVVRINGGVAQVLVSGDVVGPLASDYQRGHAPGGLTTPVAQRGYQPNAEALCGPLRRAYAISSLQLMKNSTPGLEVDVRILPARVTPPAHPSARSTADTVFVGDTVRVWGWITADERAVRDTDVFLTVAVSGFSSQSGVLWPGGNAPARALNPDAFNQPIPIGNPLIITPVTGSETVKILAGVERYDFRSLMNRVPSCEPRTRGSKGDPDQFGVVVGRIEGWSAAERRLEILPR